MSDTSQNRMIQYIQNKKETLTAQNYSPEDAMVFSQLSYIEFEKVYGPDYSGAPVSLKKFANDMLNNEIETNPEKISFLEAISTSDRYNDCSIDQLAAENEQSQWAAMTIHMNDSSDSSVIAMRGTNGTTLGWTEDFQLLYDTDGTAAQKLAARYLQNSPEHRIYLAGHSKGGNDVSSAYAMSDKATRSRVVQIDNFDGPGVNTRFQNEYAQGYAELADKLNNYYPQDSIIGLLLNDNPGKTYYVESSDEDSLLWEHDLFNWQFDDHSGFQYTEQSVLSSFLNEALDHTVSTLSQGERVLLVDLACKLGIPAYIAKQKWPPEDMSVYEKIGGGALLYLELTAGGGDVIKKTAEMLIVFSVAEAGKILTEAALKIAMQEMFDLYTQIADYLNNLKKEMADALLSFVSDLKDAIDDIADAMAQFFRQKKNWKGSGGGLPRRADFTVDPFGLAMCKNELERCRERIHENQIKILLIMEKLALYADFASACNLDRLAAKLEAEEKDCKKLTGALKNAGRRYQRSEQNLLNIT